MKKLMYALAFMAVAAMVVFSVGCSSEDKFHVYRITDKDNSYIEYDVVYYDTRSNYKGEVLTGFIDESHYFKSSWSREDVEKLVEDVYPGINNMSFASVTITEEADYYCCIVKFDDLDKLDNLKTLHDNECLFEPTFMSSSESLVSAEFFERSIVSGGGTEIDEKELGSLDIHFNAKK